MLDLKLVKKHLNIIDDFKDDDKYLLYISEVSEQAVLKDLGLTYDEACDDDGEYKTDILHSILLMVGNLYANREGTTYGAASVLPYGYQYLLDLNRNYKDR